MMSARLLSAFAVAVIAASAHAEDMKKPAAGTSAAGLQSEMLVGRTVTSSDGVILGKVTSLKAAADGKGALLYISSPTDGKIFAVPSEAAVVTDAGLAVNASAADLKAKAK